MAGTNMVYSDNQTVTEEEYPSFILTAADSEQILDSNAFKLRDVYFTGTDGFVKWTLAITNLKPGQQTRGHSHPDKDELCQIVQGDAIVSIDDRQYRVNTGKYILIEKEKHHKVINVSTTEECIFRSDFPGHLIRPGFVRKR